MVSNFRYRNDNINYKNSKNSFLEFLYSSLLGYLILKIITFPWFSKFIRCFLNIKLSKVFIPGFINKNKIDINLYKNKVYNSFNDFFIRDKKDEYKKIGLDFISPCDSKLLAYKISSLSKFEVKNHFYSVDDLVNLKICNEYKDGYCLIFRLEANNYHRYCYIDDGSKTENVFIPGKLHTVQDVALKKRYVYKENCREYTILHTNNFDDIIQIEVGALLVGKICNEELNSISYKKGQEKGHFEFGGSTIILLVKKNVLQIDKDILENSKKDIETVVNYGESIAKKSH